jgi:hypothetical protein
VIDRDELRAKAEAATPGPWWTGMHDGFSHTVEGPESDSHPVAQRLIRPDAEYIAAVSPDVVLALLDALDAAERAASPSDAKWVKSVQLDASEGGRAYEVWSPASPSDEERDALTLIVRDVHNYDGRPDYLSLSGAMAGRIADAILKAGWSRSVSRPRSDAEIEYEYGAGYEGDNGIEMKWFSIDGAFTIREAAENSVAKFNDPQVRLIRRTKPGPWEPVAAADAVRQEGSK